MAVAAGVVGGVGEGQDAAVAVAAEEGAVALFDEGLAPEAGGAEGAAEAARVVELAHEGRRGRACLQLLVAVAARAGHLRVGKFRSKRDSV